MKKIRYYITGHGLGHASRSCRIINTLKRRRPEIAVEVVSDAKGWFLKNFLDPSVPVIGRGLEFGVLQSDSLLMQEEQTLLACRALLESAERVIGAEAASLNKERVGLVVADIPFLAFSAAARAGLPSAGISNFTWDWIYEGFAETIPGFGDVVEGVRRHYAAGELFLRLPFHGNCPPMREVEDIPLVARLPRSSREEVRAMLGIPSGRKVALLSFGGFGLAKFDAAPLERIKGWYFLGEPGLGGNRSNVREIPFGQFHYPDLVRCADVVVTKPGYGIVSECIALETAVLYTDRGNFREQAVLVEGLHRFARAREIDNARLRRGELGEDLEALVTQPLPAETLRTDGDEVAAERLAHLLEA